jgi:ATP-dependent RNA helicase HelY
VRKHQGKKAEDGLLVVDPLGRYRRITADTLKHAPCAVGTVEVSKITSPTKKVRKQVGARMESLAQKSEGAPEREVAGEELELSRLIDKLSSEIVDNKCNNCAHRPRCTEAARKVEKISRQMENASRERDSGYDVVSRRLVDVVDLLNHFGFMDGTDITRKGGILRRIYNECDLLLVEAVDSGALSRLAPAELAAFASWFIYESRDGETEEDRMLARVEEERFAGELGGVLEWMGERLAAFKTEEGARGLDLLGSPDTGFGEAAFMWASASGLDDMLARFPDRSIGDMVRTMKQIIDLLRQLADVAEDPVLQQNLRRAMDSIDRGVVGYSSIESIIEHAGPVP